MVDVMASMKNGRETGFFTYQYSINDYQMDANLLFYK